MPLPAACRHCIRLATSPVVEEAPALPIVQAGSRRPAAVFGRLPLPAAAGGSGRRSAAGGGQLLCRSAAVSRRSRVTGSGPLQ